MIEVVKSILLGIGGMIGGGIFLLNGFLVYNNKNYTPLVWLIGMIIFFFISYSFMVLSIENPSKDGIMLYTEKYLNKPSLEPYMKAGAIFAFISITSVYSLSASEYIAAYFNFPHIKLISVGVIMVCILMNYMPKHYFLNTIYYLVIGKLLILFLLIAYGIYLPISKVKTEALKTSNMTTPLLCALPMMFLFSMRSFLTYEGIEFLSNVSHNIKNKQTMIPLSYIITVIIVGLVYMGISHVSHKHINHQLTSNNLTSSFLLLIESYGFTTMGTTIILILVCLANFSAINSTIFVMDESLDSFLKITKNDFLSSLNRQIKLPFITETRNLYIWLFGAIILCINMLPIIATTNLASTLFLIFFGYTSYLAYIYIKKHEKENKKIRLFNTNISPTISKIPCYIVLFITVIAVSLLLKDNYDMLAGNSKLSKIT